MWFLLQKLVVDVVDDFLGMRKKNKKIKNVKKNFFKHYSIFFQKSMEIIYHIYHQLQQITNFSFQSFSQCPCSSHPLPRYLREPARLQLTYMQGYSPHTYKATAHTSTKLAIKHTAGCTPVSALRYD